MKYLLRKFFGGLFLLIGILLIINSFSTITGFAIVQDLDFSVSSILSMTFIIVGLVLLVLKKPFVPENLAQEALESNVLPNTRSELINIAKDMRFEVKEDKNGYIILDKYKEPLIKISFDEEITHEKAKKILRQLSNEEKNFKHLTLKK
ncbi:MAG: hypothetical protein QT05_C0024G0006 [archaeon GW2011_AR13]|nr:MAG: hypothetical protein QT05_C0024G0006 [archaeon GW2011_AR13]HIG94692.1 hypothetical protein [Nanoarchaeota archaeon]HIH63488.1 hypothetical protein [Nanoarchaeota archaeon]HIJ09418.1 hypothetical protein [Nanoarchaeota archaeon]